MSDDAPSRQSGSTGLAHRSVSSIVLMPTALFAVGVVGLVAALVGEGVWDAAGSAALSVLVVLPAILALWP